MPMILLAWAVPNCGDSILFVKLMSSLILLTGASGFIGSAFLKHALANNWRVRVLTRRPHDWHALAGVEVVGGDLSNTLDWEQALHGVQVVVHAAAEIKDVALIPVVNLQGPTQLLQAAVNAGVRRWVQLSSVGAYGPVHDGVVTEEWPDDPYGPYEMSKTKFDNLLMWTAQSQSIEVCIVRPSNVYGSGMRNQSLRHMLSAIRKGTFAFVGSPGASANYVHVSDVVQALALCVQMSQAANRIYIVSAWSTMENMVNALASGAGLRRPTLRINLGLAKLLASTFKWWSRWPLTLSRVNAMSLRSRYSTRKIENELGWIQSVPVPDGMCIFSFNSSQ